MNSAGKGHSYHRMYICTKSSLTCGGKHMQLFLVPIDTLWVLHMA